MSVVVLLLVKKFLAIFFLLIYGLSSSGMTLNFHYCCGQLETVDLSPVEKESCENCHDQVPAQNSVISCCENKAVDLRVSSEQNTDQAGFKFFKSLSVKNYFLEASGLSAIEPAIAEKTPAEVTITSSPPLFILNCFYRI